MPKRNADEATQALIQMIQEQLAGQLQGPSDEELLDDIKALPQRHDLHWLVVLQPLPTEAFLPGFIEEDEDDNAGAMPTLLIIVRPDAPGAFAEVFQDNEEAEQIMLELLCGDLDDQTPAYRPGQIATPDLQMAFGLGNLLRGTGIKVVQDNSPQVLLAVREALQGVRAEVERVQARTKPQPIFEGQADDAVREYVQAFRRFMRAEAWEVVKHDRPIFAGWLDEQGERRSLYAAAMGELDESYGLVFFGDWLAYAEQTNSSYDHELVLRGLEGMEAVNVGEEHEFTPGDWQRLQALKLVGGRQRTAPALQRLSLEGTLPPRTPLTAATALLNVLADRAEKKPGKQATSLKGSWGGVDVRYPGKPAEELRPEEQAGTVTLTFRGGRWLKAGEVLTVSGPSGESVSKVRNEFERQMEAEKDRRLAGVFGFRFTRPLPDAEPDEDDYFAEQQLRVWEQGLGSPTVLMAQLTHREGLESFSTKVEATFSPEPTAGVTWALQKA